jgi:hypothetical protein
MSVAIGAMLAHNPTSKYDQPIVYAFRLFHKVKHNYIITERETLAMVYDAPPNSLVNSIASLNVKTMEG